jgi:rod shape-determining protein MreC
MRNLISFLWKNYFFFLFLILEALALFILVNTNYHQKRVVLNTTSDISGNILQVYDHVITYFKLREANEILALENAYFRNQHPEILQESDSNRLIQPDTSVRQQYIYHPAKVISSSINRRNNYLKLNRGRSHGVEPDMAVVAPNGVVGQVVEVSENFSSVMSVLNSQTRISAKLKLSNQVGSLFWDGQDYKKGKLIDIPSHVNFAIGDTVITSGYSHIYPEGILIGIVEGFNIEPGDNFFEIDVRFSVDYNNIHYVYTIENIYREELIELENSVY